MKKIHLLSIIILFFIHSAQAQDQFYGTWYIMEPGNDISRQRIVIGENGIMTEMYEDYEVEKPYWKKDQDTPIFDSKVKDDRYQIVGFSEEEKVYYGGEFFLTDQKGELKAFQMRQPSNSANEAFKKLDENKYRMMFSKTFYTKERLDAINELPPLAEITKEDLIATVKYVQSFGEQMESFLNEQKDSRMRFLISRAAENLRTQKFIDLGYNPYIYTEEWYMDKFKDDPDIKKLNELSEFVKF